MDNKNKHENHSSDLFKKLSADFSTDSDNSQLLENVEKFYGYELMEHVYNTHFFTKFSHRIRYEIVHDFIKSGDVITYRKMNQLISLSSKSDLERKMKKLMVVASLISLKFYCDASQLSKFMNPFIEEANKDNELKDIFCGFASKPFVVLNILIQNLNTDPNPTATVANYANEEHSNRFLEEYLITWLHNFPDHLTIDVYNNIQHTGTLTNLIESIEEGNQMYDVIGEPQKFNSVGWFYDYSHEVPSVSALHNSIFRKKSDRKKYIDKLYSEYFQIHDFLYVNPTDFSFFPDQHHHLSKVRSSPVFIYTFCMNLLVKEKDNLTDEECRKLITIVNQFVDVHRPRSLPGLTGVVRKWTELSVDDNYQ